MRPSPRIPRRAPLTLALATAAICVGGDVAHAQEPAAVTPAGVVRPAAALAGAALFVSSESAARRQAGAWRAGRPVDAALMEHIGSQPTATWLGEWSGRVGAAVSATIRAARMTGAESVPVFVAYNIPHRDCGGHSAGGARAAAAYRRWILELARALAGAPSVVVLEPDALAGMDCLTARAREERLGLIRSAVQTLKAAGAAVYIDAGHARWHPASTMAARLAEAGIDIADGFTLNVSNFVATDVSIAYGDSISRLTGGKHYIVDTSRNGAGGTADNQWCNPAGQSLGPTPTTSTGHPLLDALLWIKVPGESDGSCNGGPRAGAWWPDYALGLAERHYTSATNVAVAKIAAANIAAANKAVASIVLTSIVPTSIVVPSGVAPSGMLASGAAADASALAANAAALTPLGSLIERVAALAFEHCGHP